MKISARKILGGALLVTFLITLFSIFMSASQTVLAAEQNAPRFKPRFGTFDNVPSIVEGSATSNVVSSAVGVWPGRGIAIFPYFNGTNAGTANFILDLTVTYDGTNWSTTYISLTNQMNGTTAVRGFFHIPPSTLDNVYAIRLQRLRNAHTASLFPTNMVWSIYPQ
jgi:hypothetical protein